MRARPAVPARLYGGRSVGERRAERRAALIEAAITVYGQVGYRNASVKAVCDEAGLTERYFYESFASSDALLAAAYQAVAQRTREGLIAAACAVPPDQARRAMLRAYFEALRAHPQAARVFLVEIGGVSPAVDAVVRQAVSDWIAQLAPTIAASPGGPPPELLAAGIFGGVTQIALSWIASGYKRPIDAVVKAALALHAVGDPPPRSPARRQSPRAAR